MISSLYFNYLTLLRQIHSNRETIELVNYHKPQDLVDDIIALDFSPGELSNFLYEAVANDLDLLRDEKFIHLIFEVMKFYCSPVSDNLLVIKHVISVYPLYPLPYSQLLQIIRSVPQSQGEKLVFAALGSINHYLSSYGIERAGPSRRLVLKDKIVPLEYIENCISIISKIEHFNGWGPFYDKIKEILDIGVLDKSRITLLNKTNFKYKIISCHTGLEVQIPEGKKK